MNTSKKRFVDTNIFIYTLFKVDLPKYEACILLFKQAFKGAIKLWTTELVIGELVWFLARKKLSWDKIVPILKEVITTKGLEVRDKETILEVIKNCVETQDFIDGLNVTLAQKAGIKQGYSYDKGLEKWDGFERIEP